jgi:glutaminyl-peptide cyclotransferase
MKSRLVLFIALLFWVFACDDKPKGKAGEGSPKASLKLSPVFNADSAYTFTRNQVEFGPRVPGSSAHLRCGNYLVAYFKQQGAVVTEQNFKAERWDGLEMPARNIIASFKPELTKRILLMAHWDTRYVADQDTNRVSEPIDGANDGASGVAVLMEIARQLASQTDSLNVGVDILLFDVEDQGNPSESDAESWCLGSQYWSKNKHLPNYTAYYGVLLDMVGARNARFAREGISRKFAPSVVDKVWSIAAQLGYQSYFINLEARIPTIDIIEYSHGGPVYFGAYWHTHQDNMNIIDPATLKAVGQTMLTVLYNE